MVAGSLAQIKLADEPTNIKWQGHERKIKGKIPKLQFLWVVFLFLLTITLIVGLNYFV